MHADCGRARAARGGFGAESPDVLWRVVRPESRVVERGQQARLRVHTLWRVAGKVKACGRSSSSVAVRTAPPSDGKCTITAPPTANSRMRWRHPPQGEAASGWPSGPVAQ